MKRITLVVGHFGSGKTEFAMNYVVSLKKEYEKVAIVDLDIANPYFRSRERQKELLDMGIDIEFNSYGYDITEDLPAISATIKTPLENKDFKVVMDVGGDDSGARILNQFEKYFSKEDTDIWCVINANRMETSNVEGAIRHIERIEEETGLKVNGIVNNTHMVSETTTEDIIKGYRLSLEVSKSTGVPLIYSTCRIDLLENLKNEIKDQNIEEMKIFPIKLFMRPSWL